MTELRDVAIVLAQAAADAMQRDDEQWRPNAYPDPPAKVEAGCIIIYPGGRETWLDSDNAQSFCDLEGSWSALLLAGPLVAESWPLMYQMAQRIYGLPAKVKADPRAAAAGITGKVRILSIDAPGEFTELPGTTFPTAKSGGVIPYLGAPVELSVPLHKLSG